MSSNVEQSALRCWAVVPAAGSGKRMKSNTPKQYLELAGCSVIEHTLSRLGQHDAISGVMVAISQGDEWWQDVNYDAAAPLYTTVGGDERHQSVLNALLALSEQNLASDNDWVLVHDAARPCVRDEDLTRLIKTVVDKGEGGLLAMRVADTVKRADEHGRVTETVDRTSLWRALTPQMFRLGELRDALQQAVKQGLHVTDDSSAMELAGYAPLLVEGHGDNIKITQPHDLSLAALFITEQQGEHQTSKMEGKK